MYVFRYLRGNNLPRVDREAPNRLFYCVLFAVATLLAGGYFLYNTPPFMGADERNHLNRAYAISTGEFRPGTEGDRRGSDIPTSLVALRQPFWGLRFQSKTTSKAIIDRFAEVPLNREETVFVDYPNTSIYPWTVYAPAATALAVITRFDPSVLTTLRCARWAGLLTWVAAGALTLWLLPAWRGLFTVLMLLPMTTWTHATVSADTFTNSIAFLTTAVLLRYAFRVGQRIGLPQLAVLVLLTITLSSAKLVYAPLLLLALLIPADRFKHPGGKWLAGSLVTGLALATLIYWSGASDDIYLPYEAYNPAVRDADINIPQGANVRVHKDLVMRAPYRLFRAAVNGLREVFTFYARGYIGILGWIDTYLPGWAYWLGYILIGFTAVTERGVRLRQRGVLLLTVVLCYLLVILSQLLSWEEVGAHTVKAIMGRYLVPFAPFLFMLFVGLQWRAAARRYIVAAGSVALLLIACLTLHARYFGG